MGAIFGWVGEPDESALARMHARLRHRGARFAHAAPRGSAVLAAAGARPAESVAADARFALVADASIYELPGASLAPAALSRAEVLLDYLRARDAGALTAINGDFAIALWDRLERTLVLARDYTGVRPLYWTVLAGGRIAFASEYKALLALPGFDATVDRNALQRVQGAKYIPMSGSTLFSAVRSVPPGAVLAITARGEVAELARARCPPLDVLRASPEEHARRIAEAFAESMATRLRAAGRVGVALSGGVDSIGVAFACRRHLGADAPLHTFTAGSGPEDPEVRTAALVSEQLGAEHHVIEVPARRIVESLPQVVWHLEAPIARTETLQFFELGRAAAERIDTLLTGAAADALYAGMPNYKLLRLYQWLPPLRRALHEFHSLTQTGYAPRSALGRLLRWGYYRGRLPEVPRILGTSFSAPLTALPPAGEELLNAYLHGEFQEDTAQWVPKIERTLAAWGLTFTSPFLDPHSVRTAFTVPSHLKIHGWREKYILRRALRSQMDGKLTAFQKFPMRMHFDAEFADALETLLERHLSPGQVRRRGLFDPASIEAVRTFRRGGRYDSEGAMRAWTALATELWAEHFLDRRGEPPSGVLEPAPPTEARPAASNPGGARA